MDSNRMFAPFEEGRGEVEPLLCGGKKGWGRTSLFCLPKGKKQVALSSFAPQGKKKGRQRTRIRTTRILGKRKRGKEKEKGPISSGF